MENSIPFSAAPYYLSRHPATCRPTGPSLLDAKKTQASAQKVSLPRWEGQTPPFTSSWSKSPAQHSASGMLAKAQRGAGGGEKSCLSPVYKWRKAA